MYFIFDKDAVDIVCREYGGDPRTMMPILNSACCDRLRELAAAAVEYEDTNQKYLDYLASNVDDIETYCNTVDDLRRQLDKSKRALDIAVTAYAKKQKGTR